MIVTDEGFLEVAITPEMVALAKTKSQEMGALRNSIRRGHGNIVGFLGEEVVLSAWRGAISGENTFHHDVRFEDAFGDATFEVKSKDRTVPPLLHFEASIANFNTRQSADFYVFVSLFRNKSSGEYSKGWVLGVIGKDDYFRSARFLREGEYDPSNDWYCRADCYNLPYADLTRFDDWRQNRAA
jgi:hypothetical protein